METLLSIENLHTTIVDAQPPFDAVDGVSLEIGRGEILALVGESGCGKTMLALSVGRLLPPAARLTAGKVLFQGTDLASLNAEQLRKIRGGKIAYVFQDPMSGLNPVMTIGDQLIEALRLHKNLAGGALEAKVVELLDQVQIPLPAERIHQYPHQLSGGMRQRVMIAMALAGSPSLLIADEPTTALDVTTQAEVLALIRRLQEQLRMSVLLITHDLAAVAPISDRIAVMRSGKVVETGRTADIFKEPSHPYTHALLACIPTIGAGKQRLKP